MGHFNILKIIIMNEIHRIKRKDHARFRHLSVDEITKWKYDYNELNTCEYIGEWDLKAVFCMDTFSKVRFLKDLFLENDIKELKYHGKLYCKFYKIDYKDFKIKVIKYFYFLTATGGKGKIRVNDNNIKNMYDMNKKIFTNEIYKRFHSVIWNIETGKKIDDSNLHTHALITFDSTNKNFERDYSGSFKKLFKSIDLQIQKFGMNGNEEIYNDKLGYLKNEGKSILHKNYKDLEIFEHLE